jgi:hypothetical protein
VFLCSIPVLRRRPQLLFLPQCSPTSVECPGPFPASTDILPRALWIFPPVSHTAGTLRTRCQGLRAQGLARVPSMWTARLMSAGSDFQHAWICSATASNCFCFPAHIFPHCSPDLLLLEPCWPFACRVSWLSVAFGPLVSSGSRCPRFSSCAMPVFSLPPRSAGHAQYSSSCGLRCSVLSVRSSESQHFSHWPALNPAAFGLWVVLCRFSSFLLQGSDFVAVH